MPGSRPDGGYDFGQYPADLFAITEGLRTRGQLIASRNAALPAVNASPPTVTYSAGYSGNPAAQSIFGARLIPAFIDTVGTFNFSAFRVYGWTPSYRTTATFAAQPQNGSNASALKYNAGTYYTAYEGECYDSQIEISIFNDTGGYGWQLIVDGSPLTPTVSGNVIAQGNGAANPTDTSKNVNIILTWGSVGSHTIKLRLARGACFNGVFIGPQGMWQASSNKNVPQVLMFTDSYGDGNGAGGGYPVSNFGLDTYPHLSANVLGLADMWLDSIGGTGIANDGGGGTKGTYIQRLTNAISVFKNGSLPQWQRLNPDIVYIQGSTNDAALIANATITQAQLTAATNLLIALVRSTWPNAIIILTSVMLPNGFVSWSASNKTTYAALLGAAPNADLFVDAVTGSWIAFKSALPIASSYPSSLTLTAPLSAATSATLSANFTGTTASTYTLLGSDGVFITGVTLTNGSSATTWATAATSSATNFSYVNQVSAWFTGNGSYGSPYAGALTFTAALTSATSATLTSGLSAGTISAGGSGYTTADVGKIVSLVGGTGTASTVVITAVSAGAVTGILPVAYGAYTVTPTNPASTTGGGTAGSGLTVTGTYSGFIGPSSSVYSIKFSDGTIKTNVNLTNGSTSVSWTGAVTAIASASYVNTASGGDSDVMMGFNPHGTAAWHLMVGTVIPRYILTGLGLAN